MATSDLTVTGSLSDALGVHYDFARTKLWLTFNTQNGRVTDEEGVARVGAGRATVNPDGTFELTGIPKPGDSNPASFQCKIHYDAPPRLPDLRKVKRERGDFGWMTITVDADLADLEEEQAVPAEYITVVTAALDAKVTEAEGYADAAAASGTAAAGSATEAEGFRDEAETFRNEASAIALGDAEAAFDGFLATRDLPADGDELSASFGEQVETDGTPAADAVDARVETGAPVAAAPYFVRRSVQTSPQVGALVGKLRAGVSAAYLAGLGDSTMAAGSGWFNQLAAWLGTTFPAYTVLRRDWSDTNQRYEPVPTVVQTGTAGARRFVCTGASTDRFFTVADSAATSPSAELRVEMDLLIPATGTALTLAGKYDTATNNRAWFVQLGADGKLSLFFSTDGTSGTQLTRTSTAAIPGAAIGTRAIFRVDWKGDDGAGNNVTQFYYSLDRGATWTQIGSTVTTATASATIFDAATATQFPSRSGSNNIGGMALECYGLKVRTSLTTGARPVIDFETAQWNGYGSSGSSATFTDFVGNAVTIGGTGQGGSMSGAPVLYVLNGAVSGQTISYANDGTRFSKLVPLAPDLAVINYSHNEIGLVAYRSPYKTLADAIIAVGPDAGIVATVQNQRYSPATNITEHAIRGDAIRALASSQKYALIDIAAAFAATGDPQSLVLTDGIHPTSAGYTVATAEAESIFEQWLRPAA